METHKKMRVELTSLFHEQALSLLDLVKPSEDEIGKLIFIYKHSFFISVRYMLRF